MANDREFLDLTHINDRVNVLEPLGWKLEKIQSAWIMVIGAGALGNEVLKNLALIGVGNIFLIDFDIVEHTNLARSILYREEDCTGDQLKVEVAARRIKELNPDINVVTLNGDVSVEVGWGVFRRMDAIISCVDNRLARLFVNRIAHRLGKSWIDGGILDLGGQMNVFEPGVSCYECQLSERAWQNIHFRMGCANRAMRYASSGQANTIPITASIIGAIQVQEAFRIISSDDGRSKLASKQVYYEGLSSTFELLPASRLKPRCDSHQSIGAITEAKDLSFKMKVSDVLAWLKEHFDDPGLVIALDHTLIMEVGSERTGKRMELLRPRPLLHDADYADLMEDDADSMVVTQKTAEIGDDFPHRDKTLEEIGIPPLHILTLYTKGDRQFVELTGDRSLIF